MFKATRYESELKSDLNNTRNYRNYNILDVKGGVKGLSGIIYVVISFPSFQMEVGLNKFSTEKEYKIIFGVFGS